MTQPLHETLESIEREMLHAFQSIEDDVALRQTAAKFVGANGAISALLKRMPEIPGPEKKSFGQKINALKQQAEKHRDEAEKRLRERARQRELERPMVDFTLPGRTPQRGRIHPLTQTLHDLIDVFTGMGFDVAEGPEIDTAEYNFDKLGFPPDHPALDMQDTFFVKTDDLSRRPLLRTHTSTVQIREMLSHPPPVMIVAPGHVYRRDDDATHSPMFTQLEGLVVDKGVSMAHLKGTLETFVQRLFGSSVRTRFRASYFPFTEPSAELDMGCLVCGGHDSSCRVCKGTGWLEVLGCGMVHPVVFENVGYDPEMYTGFAFGLGVDRIAMLRYGVPNIRLMFESDVRFLGSL